MSDRELSKEVRALVRRLHTMEEVETLLLLAEGAPLTAPEICNRLRLPESALPSAAIGRLVAEQLVTADSEGERISYRFSGSPEVRQAVALLRAAYNERPVTLVRLIYNRVRTAESFTDAFRTREDEAQ